MIDSASAILTSNDLAIAVSRIDTRISSLRNDVRLCLLPKEAEFAEARKSLHEGTRIQMAPFPAMMVCLSTLDYFVSLQSGKNGKSPNNVKDQDRKNFVKSFSSIPEDKVFLLFEVFRNKIVHLSMPYSITRIGGKAVGWILDEHESPDHHLKIIDHAAANNILKPESIRDDVTSVLYVSIPMLSEDVAQSGTRYAAALLRDSTLQSNYSVVMKDIHPI